MTELTDVNNANRERPVLGADRDLAEFSRSVGLGFAFPFRFSGSGGVERAMLGEKIDSSIRLLLSTFFGEVVGQPNLGASFVGDVDSVERREPADLAAAVTAALSSETRIVVRDIRFPEPSRLQAEDSSVPVVIDYTLRNSDGNLVRTLVTQLFVR